MRCAGGAWIEETKKSVSDLAPPLLPPPPQGKPGRGGGRPVRAPPEAWHSRTGAPSTADEALVDFLRGWAHPLRGAHRETRRRWRRAATGFVGRNRWLGGESPRCPRGQYEIVYQRPSRLGRSMSLLLTPAAMTQLAGSQCVRAEWCRGPGESGVGVCALFPRGQRRKRTTAALPATRRCSGIGPHSLCLLPLRIKPAIKRSEGDQARARV